MYVQLVYGPETLNVLGLNYIWAKVEYVLKKLQKEVRLSLHTVGRILFGAC